uniref:PTBP1-like RNA recognition motif 2 domain-containing protein n=1 Tax=Oryza meridionalis TaxID=40149 RepID=A0A0E0F7P9_9ORYZ
MGSEPPIHGIPSKETRWVMRDGSGDIWEWDLGHGGVMSHLIYPVSTDVMHQVFNPYGVVAVQMLMVDAWRVEAIIWFRATCDVGRAQFDLHGHNIYDGGCVLDVQHVPTMLGDRADTAPTKCLTLVPRCATTKSNAESTPTTAEHVFPTTESIYGPNHISGHNDFGFSHRGHEGRH